MCTSHPQTRTSHAYKCKKTHIIVRENSFPGGRCEDGETAHETSMREMDEEIGVTPEQVWGSLSRPVVSLKLENVYASVGYIGHFEDLRMKLSVNEVNVVFY